MICQTVSNLFNVFGDSTFVGCVHRFSSSWCFLPIKFVKILCFFDSLCVCIMFS